VFYAAIDLGTNTFHILVAEIQKGKIKEIYRKRIFVNLLKNSDSNISISSYNRAKKAILYIKEIINKFNLSSYRIVGTEAFRSAENGLILKEQLESRLRSSIGIISGIQEAKLIYSGVNFSLTGIELPYTIIDIGGGSVEFVKVAEKGDFIYSDSIRIGLSKIAAISNYVDLLNSKHLNLIQDFLNHHLDMLSKYKNQNIVFNAGSFEVFERIELTKDKYLESSIMQKEVILNRCNQLIKSDFKERKSSPK